MKNTTLSLILVLFVSACSHKTGGNVNTDSVVKGTTQAEAEAQKSTEQWLTLVDAGNYAESWKTAAGVFQTAVSQDQWEHAISAVRGPLGELVSRKLKSAYNTKSLPGMPDGEYVVLVFDTSFANKKAAAETITPMLAADGIWKVSGYYIK